jgi:apolipoprotein N-acyltransferase
MTTLLPLLRTRLSAVWCLLVAATLLSWWLGTDHGFGAGASSASVVILAVAFMKARFVGLYFMELRHAPLVLRGLFEAYCLVVLAVVVTMYLVR